MDKEQVKEQLKSLIDGGIFFRSNGQTSIS